ncbi:hypothetical protein FHE66_14690 [Georgenia sp. 311]|uniref:NB-ARC domain-containing protein n=1 Tax=Georgenia sp. 311 TaxID=2585134 RepID=UPI001112367D|nr:NB-ARC domain-containing protein [Georgenia sp. 311]TNC16620.1 hypothetical protein FHE66_14690 [Georgenia sp. 311]
MTTEAAKFLPVARMLERGRMAKEDSDTAYFFDLLYEAEMVLKLLTVELIAGMSDDRERHRYALEYRLVRADGIGEWAEVLDEATTGPASQHLVLAARDSQRALSATHGPGAMSWQRAAVSAIEQACRCLDNEYQQTSESKVSLRMWARHVVWLRNRTRGHGAPKAATLATVCPALLESLTLIIENAPPFKRNWAYLKRNLSGKYRVSSFGGRRQPFEYLTQQSEHKLPDGVYIDLGDLRPVRLLFSDPDLTDFYLPNGNWRKGRCEVLSYLTDDSRTEDGAAWTLPIGAQPRSETAATPALDVVGEVFTNMPPRRDAYVPRPELERELRFTLLDSRNPVITLQGRGGVGKTSLALEVVHNIAREPEFFAIIWFSARDIDLLPQGPKVVKADVLTTEDVASDFAQLLRAGEKVRQGEAQQYLTDCLAGTAEHGPFLFVFDNFETMREQAALYNYVNNAVRLPNKVLITTRTRDFKSDYPIAVEGMTKPEFHQLVVETTAKLSVQQLVDESYEEQLYDDSGAHPYITKVLLGEVAREGRRVSLKHVVATREALLDALFDRSFAALPTSAQRVFLTLCSWRSLVPRVGLEAVLMRPGNDRIDVDSAIEALENASLVERTIDTDSGAAFVSVPLAAALFGRKKLVTSPLKLAIDADLELVRSFGVTTVTDVAQGLGPRVERMVRWASERAGSGKDVTDQLAVIEYIATEFPPAWLRLATLQQELTDLSGAVRSVNRYLETVPDDAEAWRLLTVLHRRRDDGLAELHARLQLAELTETSFEDLSTTAARLTGMLSRRKIDLNTDERRLTAGRLRALMEARVDEADATDLSRLAWLCMHLQDAAAASRWAARGLEMDARNEHCLKILERTKGAG